MVYDVGGRPYNLISFFDLHVQRESEMVGLHHQLHSEENELTRQYFNSGTAVTLEESEQAIARINDCMRAYEAGEKCFHDCFVVENDEHQLIAFIYIFQIPEDSVKIGAGYVHIAGIRDIRTDEYKGIMHGAQGVLLPYIYRKLIEINSPGIFATAHPNNKKSLRFLSGHGFEYLGKKTEWDEDAPVPLDARLCYVLSTENLGALMKSHK